MSLSNTEFESATTVLPAPSALQRFARATLFKALARLHTGTLTLHESGERTLFGAPEGDGPRAELWVMHPDFYTSVLLGGSVGAGESFMAGHWHASDLVGVIRLMSRNLDVIDGMEGGLAAAGRPLLKALHWLRKNTRAGSRANIAAHYDLGNDFFSAFLDPEMMYSSAVFPEPHADLERAAVHKLDRICRKLDLQPDDRVIEIGTGWGGFAIYAAKEFGCQVTTTTISRAQFAHAERRIREEGLTDRITLLRQDYRDLRGRFDKLVSIEMIEAVGHQFLDRYFETCARLLEPDGLMLIQAITMPDDRYHRALREVDFIKRYIFPGSFIPSVGAMVGSMGRTTDLRLVHLEDQTPHYARTLALWAENFRQSRDREAIAALPERFRRMWEFYLAYCEGGFWERVIGSAQLVFAKPQNRRDAILQGLGWHAPAHEPA